MNINTPQEFYVKIKTGNNDHNGRGGVSLQHDILSLIIINSINNTLSETPPMKRITTLGLTLGLTLSLALALSPAQAATYRIDPGHSFVQFTIAHLGFSLMQGRFNTISGSFTHDDTNPNNATTTVEVDTTSIDTNHAERDKHLRSADFLDVEKHPRATFTSTKFTPNGPNGTLEGNLTLHGVTRTVTIPVTFVGAGNDPWGGYRQGYTGKLTIKRADYGITRNLGPAAEEMELGLFIEGIRQ